jgi:hypothetical protein
MYYALPDLESMQPDKLPHGHPYFKSVVHKHQQHLGLAAWLSGKELFIMAD